MHFRVSGSVIFLGAALFTSFPVQAQVPSELEAAVRGISGNGSLPGYRYALVDLNDDGIQDAIALLSGPQWCGSGGCTMAIFAGTRHGFRLVSRVTIANQPIQVLPSKEHAWHTLLVQAKQKGLVQMPFSGQRYPSNPSLQPPASASQVAEGREIHFTKVGSAE